ncbi:MAG: septum formation initiator family protein [Candidatus Binatia bacterium]
MPLSKISQRWVIYAFASLLVTLSLFTIFGERGALHLWRLWGEKRKLSERSFLLQKENETLRERIYRLHHDDLYLEKIAREDLGLVRPGEIVYRFASSESKRNRAKAISELPPGPPRSLGQKARP